MAIGRPTKLTAEVHETIMNGLGSGVPIKVSAALADVTDATFHSWIARGRAEKERIEKGERPKPKEKIFLVFLDDATRARASGIAANVAKVSMHAAEDWRAAAWLLERADPDNFSQRVMNTGPRGGPMTVKVVYEEDIEADDPMDVGTNMSTPESETAESEDVGGIDEPHPEE